MPDFKTLNGTRVAQVSFCIADGCHTRIGLLTDPPLCDEHMEVFNSHDPRMPGNEPRVCGEVRLWKINQRREEMAYEAAREDARKNNRR